MEEKLDQVTHAACESADKQIAVIILRDPKQALRTMFLTVWQKQTVTMTQRELDSEIGNTNTSTGQDVQSM